MIEIILESLVGYTFWSLFHALGPMIWFYPLNELDITGYEVFVIVVFSPLLWLCGSLVKNLFKKEFFQLAMLILMLVGLCSFQAESTLSRLIMLSVGVGASFLLMISSWWSDNLRKSKNSFWGYTIGYFLLLSSRVWYLSITPAWNDINTNKFITSIFCLVLMTKFMNCLKNFKSSERSLTPKGQSTAKLSEVTRQATSCFSGLPFGCMCYLMHTIVGEVSVLSRYTVTGLNVPSPAPNPWGGLVLIAAFFGFILSTYSNLSHNYLWLGLGLPSSMGLMFLNGWNGYVCGLLFVVHLMSLWPRVAENIINCKNPGISLSLANLSYLIGIFGMVWCTAYNFVPFAGELARERTYLIVGLATSLITLSLMKKQDITYPICFKLNLPAKEKEVKKVNSYDETFIKNTIFLVVIFGLIGFHYRKSAITPVASIKTKSQFSALIWTFHFGYDNQGWPSLERAAKLLENSEADVITLLESDASKPYLGNNDITMWLSERLNMYSDFGPSTRDHTWGKDRIFYITQSCCIFIQIGVMLLSKYPIINSTHHLLPSPEGELAPAISATINITGHLVTFVVTHMGNDRDDLDRRLQAKRLAEISGNSPFPVVFLGYVTSSPGSRDYKHLINKGGLRDIDPTDLERWCQYIMYRDLRRLGYARISHGGLSDTELQIAKWEFYGRSGTFDNERIASDHETISSSIKFNKVFGKKFDGHWPYSNHNFHMNTPKYFRSS